MGKNLDITNMNGVTDDEEKTCGLNDMNCVDCRIRPVLSSP